MQDYLKHRKSLVAKGKKKPASISSLVSQPVLPSVSDDQKSKEYVPSILSSFLSQTNGISTNPSVSAPTVVPHCSPPSQGATGGGRAAILNRGRLTETSGTVPPVQQEDVNPPPSVSLYDVTFGSYNLARSSGYPFPGVGLGNLAVSSGMDQLCGRGDSCGLGFAIMSNVSSVSASSVFSLSDLLFPLSSSGFASFPLPQSSSAPFSSLLPLAFPLLLLLFLLPFPSFLFLLLSLLFSLFLLLLLLPLLLHLRVSLLQFPCLLFLLLLLLSLFLLIPLFLSLLHLIPLRLLLFPFRLLRSLPLSFRPFPLLLLLLIPLLPGILLRIRRMCWVSPRNVRRWGVGLFSLRVGIFFSIFALTFRIFPLTLLVISPLALPCFLRLFGPRRPLRLRPFLLLFRIVFLPLLLRSPLFLRLVFLRLLRRPLFSLRSILLSHSILAFLRSLPFLPLASLRLWSVLLLASLLLCRLLWFLRGSLRSLLLFLLCLFPSTSAALPSAPSVVRGLGPVHGVAAAVAVPAAPAVPAPPASIVSALYFFGLLLYSSKSVCSGFFRVCSFSFGDLCFRSLSFTYFTCGGFLCSFCFWCSSR